VSILQLPHSTGLRGAFAPPRPISERNCDYLQGASQQQGNIDLKITAISLTNNALLLTLNKSEFGQISELKIEDWSRLIPQSEGYAKEFNLSIDLTSDVIAAYKSKTKPN
jgi:hypothetical protein